MTMRAHFTFIPTGEKYKILLFLASVLFTCLFSSPVSALEKVSLQLRWKHQFQFAGYYAAIEKGFYADEGLEVEIYEKTPDKVLFSGVPSENADYGIADASLLLQKVQGKPVVLLAQIFQHSPLIFISLQQSGIISPYEMIDKTVMYEQDIDGAVHNAMLIDALGDLSRIKQVPHTMNYDDLLAGNVDVMSAYLTDQPFQLKRQGVAINIINPQSYGIDFYGDNLFTSEQEIQQHPERVQKMIRASLKGWDYALKHTDEIIDIILIKYNSQKLDREFLEYEARMTKMMILEDLIPLGQVNTGRYQRVAKIYQQLGLVDQAVVPDGFIYILPPVALTPEERNWLKEHPKIILGSNEETKPYIQKENDGSVTGFEVDYLNFIKEKTGVNLALDVRGWPQVLAKLGEDQLDGLSLVTKSDAKAHGLLFSDPIHETYRTIFAADSRKFMVKSLKDLSGMRIGIRKGNYSERAFFADIPGVNLVEAVNVKGVVELLAAGKVDVILGDPVLHIYLQKNTITNIEAVYIITEKKEQYGFAVRRDWPELLSIINKGLAAISEQEKEDIILKWSKHAADYAEKNILSLNENEKKWLEDHSHIRIGIDPDWAPIEFVDANGKFAGITSEFIALTEKKLGISTQLQAGRSWEETVNAAQNGKIDMLPGMVHTKEREEFLNFSIPYLEFPTVILAHKDQPYITGMSDLQGKRVAVISQYSLTSKLLKDYSDYDFVFFFNNESALEALAAKSVDFFIANTASGTYLLKRKKFSDLIVAAPTSYTFPISFAVRKDWPELIPILNKFIKSTPEDEKQAIKKSWLNLQVKREVDWTAAIGIIAVFIGISGTIVLVFVVWNRKLTNEVLRRQKVEADLQEYQHQLEELVEERTIDLARKNEELKVSERRFRALFETAGDAIFIMKEDTFLDCNNKTLELFNSTREQIINHSPQEFSPSTQPDGSNSTEKALEKLQAAFEGDTQNFEWQHKKYNGELFDCEVSLSSFELGGEKYLQAIVRDISDRKKLEQELRQAQKMEAIGTLAGGIAHDFNNILSAIFGYTELSLMEVKDNPKLTENLNEVWQAGGRAKDLVKQILTFSRKTEQEKRPLQMSLVVKEACKLLRSSIPTTISFKTNIVSTGSILADPTQIHQIIMNLCTNAYHAIGDKGGTLGVSLQEVESRKDEPILGIDLHPGKYLQLEVSDTGCGMDSETRGKIFEPYFTTKEKGEGTGLGLAVVHGIVQAHNGHIHVYSERGEGTTFHVYLPLFSEEPSTDIVDEDTSPTRGAQEKIMFVDDEVKLVNLAEEIFINYGYSIVTFQSGIEALAAFESEPGKYDLIITDQTMPGMTGTDMAVKMMKIRPDLPIILCTGFSATINKEKALKMGITEFIQKPVVMSKLVRNVRKILDTPR